MSRLILVRHGQASFWESDYDRLSDAGFLQAGKLAEYWIRLKFTPHQVFFGPRKRHSQTERAVARAYEQAGRAWPDPQILEGLDEYQAETFLSRYLPRLAESDSNIRELQSALEKAEAREEKRRAYQRLFEAALYHWIGGDIDPQEVESWGAFEDRVYESIDTMTHCGQPGRDVVAFTSGGPSAVAAQRALETVPEKTLQLSWMIRNSAMTSFLFTQGRFTLSAFNEVPHLPDPNLWTYR